MAKHPKPEEIVAKLRQADVLISQTQTRRVIKPEPVGSRPREGSHMVVAGEGFLRQVTGHFRPRWQRGDRLWVKETHQFAMSGNGPCVLLRATASRWSPEWTGPDEGAGPSYDYDRCPGDYSRWAADVEGANGPWRSPLSMPRWASRLTLLVTDVRVQRLQDLSDEDAMAEGLACLSKDNGRRGSSASRTATAGPAPTTTAGRGPTGTSIPAAPTRRCGTASMGAAPGTRTRGSSRSPST